METSLLVLNLNHKTQLTIIVYDHTSWLKIDPYLQENSKHEKRNRLFPNRAFIHHAILHFSSFYIHGKQ